MIDSEALLALIADLYRQIAAAQQRITDLEKKAGGSSASSR